MNLLKKYALKIDLPSEILNVIKTIEQNGFEAYVAGGAVRDFLMKRKVSDYDITTSATPDDIRRIFKKQGNKNKIEAYKKLRFIVCPAWATT